MTLRREDIVPGGILPSDHRHWGTNDGTCSRCRRLPPEDDVPVLLWSSDGDVLLIYCQACLGERRVGSDGTLGDQP